jgi:4-carboxymuconolactone decarboxylase
MEESERYKRGWEVIEEVDAEAGERVLAGVGALSPELARHIIEYGYGDVWSRPVLDLKQRELATVSGLIALGHCRPQLKVHMSGMLRVGWTREELIELIVHMAVYVGFPTALEALSVAAEVLAE